MCVWHCIAQLTEFQACGDRFQDQAQTGQAILCCSCTRICWICISGVIVTHVIGKHISVVIDIHSTCNFHKAVCIPRPSRSVCQCPRADRYEVMFTPGATYTAAATQPFQVAHKCPSNTSLHEWNVEIQARARGTSDRGRGGHACVENACCPYWLDSRCVTTVISAAQLLCELCQV